LYIFHLIFILDSATSVSHSYKKKESLDKKYSMNLDDKTLDNLSIDDEKLGQSKNLSNQTMSFDNPKTSSSLVKRGKVNLS